ncbi:MAG: S-layer homology domain-containing protein [Pelotomaculum sp.]|nr:S-layer homology domain-containing protein [Pelotomaculum sp.]
MRKFLVLFVVLPLLIALPAGAALAKPGNVKASGERARIEAESRGGLLGGDVKASSERARIETENRGVLKGLKQRLGALNSKEGENQVRFSDVKEHWAKSSINKMSAIGLFNGYGDGTFRPDDPITGAEAVALVMRMADVDEPEEDIDTGDAPDWAKKSVQKAVYKGVININRFHSQVQASRAQTAVMVAKALNLSPVDTAGIPFVDGVLISPEDAGYIMALYQAGIIKGTPDGRFNPNSSITRAEMAVIMERIVSQQQDESQTNAEGGTGGVQTSNEETAGSGAMTQTGDAEQASENTQTSGTQ